MNSYLHKILLHLLHITISVSLEFVLSIEKKFPLTFSISLQANSLSPPGKRILASHFIGKSMAIKNLQAKKNKMNKKGSRRKRKKGRCESTEEPIGRKGLSMSEIFILFRSSTYYLLLLFIYHTCSPFTKRNGPDLWDKWERFTLYGTS